MLHVRPPAVAGVFYPADPAALLDQVRRLLEAVPVPPDASTPRAFIVPHAGYRYSGPIAATAYALLPRLRDRPRSILLVGPAHHGASVPVALSGADGFATPLGALPVDRARVQRALALPGTGVDDVAHMPEHCLEVQLPFLQATLGTPAIVPLLAEARSEAFLGPVLDALWDGDDTLVVVSSDLSHYLAYGVARARDRATAAAIEALDADAVPGRGACGCPAVRALLRVARTRGLRAHTLDLRSSGDTAGDRGSVVGYGAFVFEDVDDHG